MLYDNFIQFRSRLVGMADEVDSKSIGSDTVRVQVPQPALLGRGESLKNNIVYVILATLFHSAAVRSHGAFFVS